MKITIKTREEMLEDPAVIMEEDKLMKGEIPFFLDCNMEDDLCGKTLEVIDDLFPTEEYPYAIFISEDEPPWYIPEYAVKEVLED